MISALRHRILLIIYLHKPKQGSIFLEDTPPYEVLDMIKELNNNKSSDIPIVAIKHCPYSK